MLSLTAPTNYEEEAFNSWRLLSISQLNVNIKKKKENYFKKLRTILLFSVILEELINQLEHYRCIVRVL